MSRRCDPQSGSTAGIPSPIERWVIGFRGEGMQYLFGSLVSFLGAFFIVTSDDVRQHMLRNSAAASVCVIIGVAFVIACIREIRK